MANRTATQWSGPSYPTCRWCFYPKLACPFRSKASGVLVWLIIVYVGAARRIISDRRISKPSFPTSVNVHRTRCIKARLRRHHQTIWLRSDRSSKCVFFFLQLSSYWSRQGGTAEPALPRPLPGQADLAFWRHKSGQRKGGIRGGHPWRHEDAQGFIWPFL